MNWNRSNIFTYMNTTGLSIRKHMMERGYYIEFYKDNNKHESVSVLTDWGYIRGVDSIALCTYEVVILSQWEDMKVNLLYRKMDKFEVRVLERE